MKPNEQNNLIKKEANIFAYQKLTKTHYITVGYDQLFMAMAQYLPNYPRNGA